MSIQLLLWRQWFLGVSKELARKPVNFVPLLCFIQVCTESLIPAAEKEIRGLRVSSWFSCCCWIPGRIFKFYSKMYLEPCYLKNKKQTNQKAIWKPFISFIFPSCLSLSPSHDHLYITTESLFSTVSTWLFHWRKAKKGIAERVWIMIATGLPLDYFSFHFYTDKTNLKKKLVVKSLFLQLLLFMPLFNTSS